MNDLSTYKALKGLMQTGDLLQWQSDSIVGAAIRVRTRSMVNHSSLVLRFPEYEGADGRRFTTEALAAGTVLNLLSRRLESHRGMVWWYPLDEEKCPVKRVNIGLRALEFIGRPYDYKSIARQLLGRVSVETNALFCSEYCALCYGVTGEAPTPADMPSLGYFKEPVRIL